MLVVAIIGILAGLVIPRLVGKSEQAKKSITQGQMSALKTALQEYEMDQGVFPSTSEGLEALVKKPGSAEEKKWHKYMDKVPKDAWDHPFTYAYPSQHGMDYDLSSPGRDGQLGTADDINSWDGADEGKGN